MKILLILLTGWLLFGLAFFVGCLRAGHSRRPGDLLSLGVWSLTWPFWTAWVALLRFLGVEHV